jgi:hypothetical protein
MLNIDCASPYHQIVILILEPLSDVQLLVVNRESLAEGKPKLCGVGEIGEIFVRAGGLAEGWSPSPPYFSLMAST